MNAVLRILLVEDSEDDAELILRELRRGGLEPAYERVYTPGSLRQLLTQETWDVILADYSMPRFSALEALRILKESGIDLPFIVVSGTIGEDVAVGAMKAGAHDYLMKENLSRLVPAVEREIRAAHERHAQRVAEQTVWHQAYHDALTGLPNRALFLDRLHQAVVYLRRQPGRLALLFLDLDRFKYINDSLGHTVGDEVLRNVAKRLVACVREEDALARLGGDEFALLLTRATDREQVASKAQRLLQSLDQPQYVAGRELHVGASIGIALFPDDAREPDVLLRNADVAMYQAKFRGGNGYAFFTPDIDMATSRRFTLENALRRALREQEFVLHYQPQVHLVTGKITGVEALLRWHDPDLGVLSPDHFIGVAEETGLIVPLGEWVLEQACRDYSRWLKRGCAPPRLAVNLSARQLRHADLLECVRNALDRSCSLSPILEFEITESQIMQDPEGAVETVHALKQMGVQVAVDDFGIGYSSLAYLKRFPIDALKIDRSFVRDIPKDPDDAAIVTAIISMAKSLRLTVIAEGVETEAQRTFLRRQQCEEIQGFLFSNPLPAEQLERFLAATAAS
jgi:diguanylate cyclase (GGDEF)-like protein